MADVTEAVLNVLAESVAAAFPLIVARVPPVPAAELGRMGAPPDDGAPPAAVAASRAVPGRPGTTGTVAVPKRAAVPARKTAPRRGTVPGQASSPVSVPRPALARLTPAAAAPDALQASRLAAQPPVRPAPSPDLPGD